jgi:hypothetical protein
MIGSPFPRARSSELYGQDHCWGLRLRTGARDNPGNEKPTI